jgi:Fe-S-cluster containining protein
VTGNRKESIMEHATKGYGMREDGFICKRCGHCCRDLYGGFSFTVGEAEVALWAEEAPRLLDWLSPLHFDPEHVFYDGWVSPVTGEDVNRCPWLRIHKHQRYKIKGAHCLIQDCKPPVCDEYPHDIFHALITRCPGFDHLSEEAKQVEARKTFILRLYDFLEAKLYFDGMKATK